MTRIDHVGGDGVNVSDAAEFLCACADYQDSETAALDERSLIAAPRGCW